jgi:hypothetical protein
MPRLFIPAIACILLSGCALPLMQMAGSQMMSGTPACAAGTSCPPGFGNQITAGVGSSLQKLTGLASADQPMPK